MLLPIVFQCVEGDFSWTPGYMHRPVQVTACALNSDLSKIRLTPDYPERNCCLPGGVIFTKSITFTEREELKFQNRGLKIHKRYGGIQAAQINQGRNQRFCLVLRRCSFETRSGLKLSLPVSAQFFSVRPARRRHSVSSMVTTTCFHIPSQTSSLKHSTLSAFL